jgi:hypothetical protein
MTSLREEWVTNLIRPFIAGSDVGWVPIPGDVVCDPVDRTETYGLVVGVSCDQSTGHEVALVLWTSRVTSPTNFSAKGRILTSYGKALLNPAHNVRIEHGEK